MAKLTATLFVLLAVFGGSASAQEQDKLLMLQSPCAPFPEMAQLAEQHGEKPLFMGEGLTFAAGTGQSYRGGMVFTVNQDDGNWTLFQVFGDGMTCMLMNGGKFQPYFGGND